MFLNINIFPANVLQKHKYINLHYNISIWNICFYDSLHQSTFLNFQTFAVPCMIEITYKTETLLFLYWFWLYTRLFVYNLKLIIELKIWRTYIDKYLVILFAQFFRSVKMSVSRVWGCSMRASFHSDMKHRKKVSMIMYMKFPTLAEICAIYGNGFHNVLIPNVWRWAHTTCDFFVLMDVWHPFVYYLILGLRLILEEIYLWSLIFDK